VCRHTAGVAVGSVVSLASAPLASGVLERVVDGRALSRWWMLAANLGIVGSALLCASKLGQNTGSGASTVLGIGLGLLAGSTYAIYSWASHHLMNSGITRAASMGAVFGGGWTVADAGSRRDRCAVARDTAGLRGRRLHGAGADVRRLPAVRYGLTKVPASTATTITLTEPAIATLLAVLIVGERLGLLGWTGLAVIAIVLVILAVAPTNADQQEPVTTASPAAVTAAR
jgi:drug/metabolite transporter, DME family